MGDFRELRVWCVAKDLSVKIYQLTQEEAFAKDYGLKDQIRRAAVSVPSNIAEGDERESNKEAVRYLYIAKGSLAEVLTQLIIAYEIGYIGEDELRKLEQEIEHLSTMLSKLIGFRKHA